MFKVNRKLHYDYEEDSSYVSSKDLKAIKKKEKKEVKRAGTRVRGNE